MNHPYGMAIPTKYVGLRIRRIFHCNFLVKMAKLGIGVASGVYNMRFYMLVEKT